jgi:hypothetical protein
MKFFIAFLQMDEKEREKFCICSERETRGGPIRSLKMSKQKVMCTRLQATHTWTALI